MLKVAITIAPVLILTIVLGLAIYDYRTEKTAQDLLRQIQLLDAKQTSAIGEGQGLDPRTRQISPIFGSFDANQNAKANQNAIPTTSLSLELHAIFYSSDPKEAAALISKQKNKKAKLYYIKNPIMNGVWIEQVLRDTVVINRNGNSESLRLPRLGEKS